MPTTGTGLSIIILSGAGWQGGRDKALNAKYAISCARKLGCTVFLLWEDIVEVHPKMVMVFVATLMAHATARTN